MQRELFMLEYMILISRNITSQPPYFTLFSAFMRPTLLSSFFVLIAAGLLISGCGPSTVNQLTKNSEARQLSADEILSLTKGNTLFMHGHKIDSHFYFDQSGNTFAKDIFNNTDKGIWDVSSQAELCFKMDEWWLKNLRCFPVYQDGSNYFLFNNSGVLEFSAEHINGDSESLYRELPKSERTFLISESQKQQTTLAEPEASTKNNLPPTDSNPLPGEPSEEELKSTVKWMAKDCPDCNLKEANLEGADLIGAQLEGADLTGANLSKANLRRANLQDADLENANLTYANMPGANLRDSDLTDANLTGANLIRADLTGADIDGAIFTGALLEGVEGLNR